MAIGPDAFSVGLRKGQVARACAGCDDDVLSRQLFGLTVLGDGEFVGGDELAVAHMDGDLVLLHQVTNALIELLGDAA